MASGTRSEICLDPEATLMRWQPLDLLPSIKLKLSVVIIGAIAIAAVISSIGLDLQPSWVGPVISMGIGVAIMWVFAGGITSPLRAMARATTQMAQGDYETRVPATSSDEVGELARAFNAMAARLAEVDQERRDLVAMVSHELRTPITALQANLENIVDGLGGPVGDTASGTIAVDSELVHTMLRQTERLGRLVEQLLDLSRLESGATRLDARPINVSSMLAEVKNEAGLHYPDTRVEVEVQPPELELKADAERLHQAVANLVDNASRFSPAGERVRVSARAVVDGVSITVEDRGPGIPSGDMNRVFERYQRGAAARGAGVGGSGLGLAIARWIVDLHGGTIHAEQAEPTGCRMVLVLPTSPRHP
jgi:signal transduction histidine kinase